MLLNLLPEFPYKSFILTAILRITQYDITHINGQTPILSFGCLWFLRWGEQTLPPTIQTPVFATLQSYNFTRSRRIALGHY